MKTDAVFETNSIALSRFPNTAAMLAMFLFTLRQYIRGQRLLVVSLLFSLPAVIAAIANLTTRHHPPAEHIVFAFVFNLIPHAFAPIAALLYSAGIIQDDVEEQTLTYLMLRPVPRFMIYIIKLVGTILITSLLTAIFTTITYVVISLTTKNPEPIEVIQPALKAAALLTLAQACYCGFFGLLSLLMKRSLMIGVVYIVFFEGILASIDLVARRMTIMYHFRVLVLRWLHPASGKNWGIDLLTAPNASTSVEILLGITLFTAIFAATLFSCKEFRMKTPEGN
jgi:ABC-2 type transport system permease protein